MAATAATSSRTISRADSTTRTTAVFSLQDRVGALDAVLSAVRGLNINLSRIESRPSTGVDWDYDFFIDFSADEHTVATLLATIQPLVKQVRILRAAGEVAEVPWFPRKITDLDEFASKVMEYGADLDADHPGFKDPQYRQRRQYITERARTYRQWAERTRAAGSGFPLPTIEYTKEENETWGVVFDKLTALFPSHACREHQYIFPLLVQNCGYSRDRIPQLEDVSRFLRECTGFRLRPVMGLLTSRDFLNSLAFRVFNSTQYIRHHSQPLYTPEPDVCHELLGHVPLFADPDFAEFSQEIGLASLGASEDDVKKLATIYWFTVEFGVCKQDNELRAYGAGLLSSFGELEYCVSSKPTHVPFDAHQAAVQPYPITTYQPLYFVAESFADATDKVRDFASKMVRPFAVRYNPYTEMIEVLNKKETVVRFASNIRADMKILLDAIRHLDVS